MTERRADVETFFVPWPYHLAPVLDGFLSIWRYVLWIFAVPVSNLVFRVDPIEREPTLSSRLCTLYRVPGLNAFDLRTRVPHYSIRSPDGKVRPPLINPVNSLPPDTNLYLSSERF